MTYRFVSWKLMNDFCHLHLQVRYYHLPNRIRSKSLIIVLIGVILQIQNQYFYHCKNCLQMKQCSFYSQGRNYLMSGSSILLFMLHMKYIFLKAVNYSLFQYSSDHLSHCLHHLTAYLKSHQHHQLIIHFSEVRNLVNPNLFMSGSCFQFIYLFYFSYFRSMYCFFLYSMRFNFRHKLDLV